MRFTKALIIFLFFISGFAFSQNDSGKNIKHSYSGKFGFYNPSDGLNNGLLFGVDGITEFIHYNFFISGAADIYFKKTLFFRQPHSFRSI